MITASWKMAALTILAAVASIVIATIWFWKSSRFWKMVNQVPGPPTLPLIGNAHQLSVSGADFLGLLKRYANEYKHGGMFRLWFGSMAMVVVYKAETCEVVLNSTKHMEKSWQYQFLYPWLGTGLLTSAGKKWHGRRKLLTPTFHFKILADFVSIFNDQSRILTKKLKPKVGDKPFNIFNDITLCALDIICETAMGRQINAQGASDSSYVNAVNRMSAILMKRMKAPWYWPDILFNSIGEGVEHTSCLKILHGFTQKVIQEKKAELANSEKQNEGKKRLAFMDLLLHMSEGGNVLTDDDIREEVDTFMFEGHDTTAAAMTWVVYLIGHHPDVQNKVHEELNSVFGESDRNITMDDLTELKYLECCIKEALRLYPSVPMFGRCLESEAEVGGKILPKGTTINVFTLVLHRDPKVFPNPEVFDPERFLPENSEGRHPYGYIPFSAGMRNCIGQKFALMEEKVVVANIFRNFAVTSHQKMEDMKPVGDLILRPESGIIVTLKNRT